MFRDKLGVNKYGQRKDGWAHASGLFWFHQNTNPALYVCIRTGQRMATRRTAQKTPTPAFSRPLHMKISLKNEVILWIYILMRAKLPVSSPLKKKKTKHTLVGKHSRPKAGKIKKLSRSLSKLFSVLYWHSFSFGLWIRICPKLKMKVGHTPSFLISDARLTTYQIASLTGYSHWWQIPFGTQGCRWRLEYCLHWYLLACPNV